MIAPRCSSSATRFGHAIGTDVSAEMVRRARAGADASACGERIDLRVDPAETLVTVPDGSVDAVLCVGALEHMLDKPGAIAQARRVLRPGGRFVCLTPNGEYFWYGLLAPGLGLQTRHLSTDRFLAADELTSLVGGAGLDLQRLEHWRFIPKGDIPLAWGHLLHGADVVGQVIGARVLRGGLALMAERGP
ncbi:MAG: class I SAM-dependent methyltransferase [Actinobacteria bacterium]|nr:class I SAM-dependent methyltransferase [Actinomycetota bacterium]